MRQYSGVIGYTHLGSVAQLVVQPTNASTRAASLRSFGAAQRAGGAADSGTRLNERGAQPTRGRGSTSGRRNRLGERIRNPTNRAEYYES